MPPAPKPSRPPLSMHNVFAKPSWPRRILMIAAAAGGLSLAATHTASAQDFPRKPVTIVASAAPGGGVDLITRAIARALSEQWKQPVLVENKAGASGMIGSEQVARAAPDGYTLLTVSLSHATNPSLYKKMPYNTVADFTPLSLLAKLPIALVVTKSLPVNSVKELIDYAKANPNKLNCGSGGNGTSQHLSCELFKSMAGVQIQHVPYRGVAAAGVDVIGGRIEMMFDQISFAEKNARAGNVKALAVTTPRRSPLMPELPTLDEAGVPGYASETWFGLLGPAKMPAELANRIQADLARAMTRPEVQQALASQNFDLVWSTPAAFGRFLDAEMAKWDKAIKQAGIQPD
ncbi:MAG: tripartite tricarboxylate transporter substrate binding protein [Burkholderiales bacterium]